jgi:hypothetical protein
MGLVFAQVKPVRLVRGTRWQDQVQLVDENSGDPIDLEGIESLVMTVREEINGPVILQLDLDDGLAVADAEQGLVNIDVSSARTLEFPENDNARAKYVFDALIEREAGEFEPAFAGKVTVLPSNTRPWAAT